MKFDAEADATAELEKLVRARQKWNAEHETDSCPVGTMEIQLHAAVATHRLARAVEKLNAREDFRDRQRRGLPP